MTKNLSAEQLIRDRIDNLEATMKVTKNRERYALLEYAKITLEDLLLELTPLDF